MRFLRPTIMIPLLGRFFFNLKLAAFGEDLVFV